MLNWLVSILMSLGLPALKMVLLMVLSALESKYPGLKPLVDQIIHLIEGGMSAEQIQAHVEKLAKPV